MFYAQLFAQLKEEALRPNSEVVLSSTNRGLLPAVRR
jgi:hypothetical protein